jgi:hypothetical protein
MHGGAAATISHHAAGDVGVCVIPLPYDEVIADESYLRTARCACRS